MRLQVSQLESNDYGISLSNARHRIDSLEAEISVLQRWYTIHKERIAKLESELEAHAWEISPVMAHAKIDELSVAMDDKSKRVEKRTVSDS